MYTFKESQHNSNLIAKINKIYHDEEASVYENSHPEIYSYELKSWNKLFCNIRTKLNEASIVVIDVGTGAGFVPTAISSCLSFDDLLIASYISSVMLSKAEINLRDCKFRKEFLETSTYETVLSNSVDIITMNSVLHHIPDVKELFTHFDRMLKPGGFLIIKHEPNIRFANNHLLRIIYLFLRKINSLKHIKKTHTINPFFTKVIKELERKEIVFHPPITQGELQALVDIQSPTAGGGIDSRRGFDPLELHKVGWKKAYTYKSRTYGYFGKIRDDTTTVRKIFSSIFKFLFKKDGYFFDVVIRKSI